MTGLWDFYDDHEPETVDRYSWADILKLWGRIEADLQQQGVDLDQPGIRHRRSWRWLKTRILGLLEVPPVIVFDPAGGVHYVPQSRLGLALDPPDIRPPAPSENREDD